MTGIYQLLTMLVHFCTYCVDKIVRKALPDCASH